ncbi:hypothetical protein [Paenibacillus ihuae]|uniref:hypothetical protein n=1 Tax=Paenibacillus ihuae TaxID=1232431 RepID=UPI0006D547CD|nr:hypothetical protein [Paenibacillus ihuae]
MRIANKTMVVTVTLLLSLTGCSNFGVKGDVQADHQEASSMVAAVQEYDLSSLVLELPADWELDTGDQMNYLLKNDRGESVGRISSSPYVADFEFKHALPNHSSVINDETITLPAGVCRLITLDADNGPAASGATGTHNTYYGIVTIKDKVIYILEFTNLDKDPQSKQQFIDLLNKISLKEPVSRQ